MSKNNRQEKGLHIGSYRITPLGIVVFAVIIVAILAVAAYFIISKLGGDADPKTDPAGGAPVSQASPAASLEPVDVNDALVLTANTPTPAPPTAEPTAEPTPTAEPVAGPVTMRVLGEIIIDDNILSSALQADGSYSFADIFSSVSAAMGNADYTIANVEGAMGGANDGYTGKNEYNTPESIITDLADAGVDMLALANDHALDNFFQGLLGTVANCNEAGMDYVGAAATQEEHDTPKIVNINGANIGFLNYTTTLNSKEKATSEDAVKYGVNLVSESNCVKDIEALNAAGADAIVCIVSWSKDGSTEVTKAQRRIMKALSEAGVDVIIGYGPRVAQPVGWVEIKDKEGNVTNRTLCVSSVGTFLSDSTSKTMDCGTIFEFTLTPQTDGSYVVESPKSIPTYVWRYTEGEKYAYRVLACGEWTEEQPDGMDDATYQRMQAVWQGMSKVVTEASVISAN
jgi:poly-gamma-glutamate capsule biosynthesis protein CapA/YwtB (metallophosphatase superfamily)